VISSLILEMLSEAHTGRDSSVSKVTGQLARAGVFVLPQLSGKLSNRLLQVFIGMKQAA
jgi:hypothetical protein